MKIELDTSKGVVCLERQSYTACYGNLGLVHFLQPSCNTGETMAVVGVNALAKKLETDCPVEISTINEATTPTLCCQYDPTDCHVRYSTSVYRNYYSRCNGEESCLLPVSWVPTPCNLTVYLPRTNYMRMEYYCIADQGVDPCTNLNTKDSRVFLWNSGYPTAILNGSSSCTCSVEASCDSNVKLTAIDLRLGTDTTCGPNIYIIDGASTHVFNCSNNNDYLPTVLLTSTSHFIQIKIEDNLDVEGGYYFILLEGAAPGSELTLSCSSTAQTIPNIPASNLSVCPNETTTNELVQYTTTESETTPSTITSDMVDTSTKSETTTPSTITSDMVDTSTESEEATLSTITSDMIYTSTVTISYINTSTTPDFVSFTWTSTEKDITAGLTAVEYTSTDDVIGPTAKTDSEKSDSTSTIVGVVVVLFVLIGLILTFILYKDKFKEYCCTKKASSKVDVSDTADDENPLFASFFDVRTHQKPNQLPPLTYRGNVLANSRCRDKIQKVEEKQHTKKKKKKKAKDISDKQNSLDVHDQNSNILPTEKGKKKDDATKTKKKRKKHKKPLSEEKSEEQFKPKVNSYSKSTFGATITGLDLKFSKSIRRTSVIDISDSRGQYEKPVEIVSSVDLEPVDISSAT